MRISTIAQVLSSLSLVAAAATSPPVKAIAVLRGDSTVKGTVTFRESPSGKVTVTWNITGSDANTERGFHVHTYGDLSGGCASAGPHYNPYGKDHGAPTDQNRHVGDLGNIKIDAAGSSQGSLQDKLLELSGSESIIGRAVVVHGGVDDLGKTAHPDSKKTGNAGPRPACGVIGLSA
jgi:Cu-Zn family superoxide dismutase